MNVLINFRRILVPLIAISLIACDKGPSKEQKAEVAEFTRLNYIQAAYQKCLEKTKKPPMKPADLAKFFPEGVDVAEVYTSKRDGQPFVIIWGADFRKHVTSSKPLVLGYEQSLTDSKRMVWTSYGVLEMTDTEFLRAAFPLNHRPKL
ncbi:MAG: hypothetical protein O3A00_04585 [Planctomycetota bacterium]|nr:hypothetical protein [Planctomycetota bacterium]